jgi:hypothetical protein
MNHEARSAASVANDPTEEVKERLFSDGIAGAFRLRLAFGSTCKAVCRRR